MKNKLLVILSVLLCNVLLFSLYGCAGKTPEITENTVEVKTEGGLPLSNINVFIYKDESQSELVWAGNTGKDGKASFSAPIPEKCVAVLKDVPDGYAVSEDYSVTAGLTEISLETVIEEGDISSLQLKRGSVMKDFTVKSVSGTEYRLSELLEEKKAVVLNFWFLNCQPCKMEFPHMEAAYSKYEDKIELIAMNPVDGTDTEILSFADTNGLTFPMAKCAEDWAAVFDLTAYPTTVVIDRYGVICLIHKGTIPEAETFEKLFAHFTADDYTQEIIKSIDDIK